MAFAFLIGQTDGAETVALSRAAAPAVAARPGPRIVHYDVTLEPELASQSVTGVEVLTVEVPDGSEQNVVVNRGALVIDAVEEQQRAVAFVTSADLRAALEQESRRNLANLFQSWVGRN